MKYFVLFIAIFLFSCAGWQTENTFRAVVKVYDKWGNTYACVNESLINKNTTELSVRCMFTTGEVDGKIYKCSLAATTDMDGKQVDLQEDCKTIINLEDTNEN